MNASVQKEGFNLSSRHDFGNPSEYFDQFRLLVAYDLVTVFDTLEQSVYWYETEDKYLQLASQVDNGEPVIIAQFKRSSDYVGIELKKVLIDYIKRTRHITGFPQGATREGLYSVKRFDKMIDELIAEFEANREEALKNNPVLTELFEQFRLDPHPSENDANQWNARCPRCRKFYIYFTTNSLRWGCPYCGFHGEGEQEFRTAMKMVYNPTVKNKEDYKINTLLGELRKLSTEQERIDRIAKDIKSGENRYKIVSDRDYNLLFELFRGIKLEHIPPRQVWGDGVSKRERRYSENFVYETYVSLEATDGFNLNYRLEWTEGEPLTGMVKTPYNWKKN